MAPNPDRPCEAREHRAGGPPLVCPECRAALRRQWLRLRQESAQARRRVPARRQPPLVGFRVLVVDDDALVRDATRLLLEAEGARVTEARDGADALRVLRRQEVDLVLCDLCMPGLDGAGLVQRIREDPRWAATPVIALSAHSAPPRMDESGFDAHLGKPFEAAELTSLLARFRRRRAR